MLLARENELAISYFAAAPPLPLLSGDHVSFAQRILPLITQEKMAARDVCVARIARKQLTFFVPFVLLQ